MNKLQITTLTERDAMPVGTIVIDVYAATCIRARMSDPPMPSDWVRVTTAVKGGEHHHGPFLPADVERVGWSDYQSTPDATARTEPTEDQVAEAAHRGFCERRDGDLPNTFEKYDELDAERMAWWRSAAHAVLALLPQRVAPSEEEIARAIFDVRDGDLDVEEWEETNWETRERYECDARAVQKLYASQPTVAEVRAQALRDARAERGEA